MANKDVCIYKPFHILLSDSINKEEKAALIRDFGVDDILIKPVSKAQIESLLQEYNIIFENT